MIEFGTTLRLAREAKGYSQAQVAEMTRMAPSTVIDLENENFERIAAPIYGRGFVKLYCEAVGIDPKPLIDEFMAIYNGERDTGIRERKPAAAPAKQPEPSAPAPEPVPAPEVSSVPDAQEPARKLDDEPLFAAEPPRPPVAAASEEPTQVVSRYAAPMRTESTSAIPPSFWRICALVAVAIVVLWGIVVGVRALYRATTSEKPAAVEPADRSVAPKPSSKDQKPSPKPAAIDIKRESQKIPSLYID